MVSKTDRKAERVRRHVRVRTKISGTADRPRLCIYRSNTNLYVQIIDDVQGKTLAQASTMDKDIGRWYFDVIHINQYGLNVIGKEAGKYVGKYAKTHSKK